MPVFAPVWEFEKVTKKALLQNGGLFLPLPTLSHLLLIRLQKDLVENHSQTATTKTFFIGEEIGIQ